MTAFKIHRVSAPRETLSIRPRSATECKSWFINHFPRFYRLALWDETGDGQEIFIVIASETDHIRFHAIREK